MNGSRSIDPYVHVSILSANPLPRNGGGSQAPSWVVAAKILAQDQGQSKEESHRTKPSRVGIWNEELVIPLDADDVQSCILQLDVLDATLREERLEACTFKVGDFVPWNGYHLDVHVGRDIRLLVSIVVAFEDPVVKIQHFLYMEALLLTFPEGMPLPGVRREAGAGVKSFIQCIPKGTENEVFLRNCKKNEPPRKRYDATDGQVIELGAPEADSNGGNSYSRSTNPVTIIEDQVAWDEIIIFPLGPRVKKSYMGHTRAYPRQLFGEEEEWDMYQVSFLVCFFMVEASSQGSTALGFVVLEIPKDVKLGDAAAELSGNVISPQGKTLEDVVCVVDIRVSGPPPRSPRESKSSEDADEDNSDLASDTADESEARSALSENTETRQKSVQRQTTVCDSKAKEMHSGIEMLQEELRAAHVQLDQKQAVVDNLSEQVEKRSGAIRKCGKEILKLRKYVEDIEHERCRLHSQLKTLHRTTAEAEMEANRVMKAMEHGDSAGGLAGDTGGRHTRALAKRCILLTEENRTLRKVAQDCAHERWQTAVLKSEMDKMKKTQHVQATYIRKMQALPAKVLAYKSTVSMQEKVIAKLEVLVAGRRPSNRGSTDGEEGTPMEKHGKDAEVIRLRNENSALRMRLATEGSKSSSDIQGKSADDTNVILQIKESKIRILEQQMVENAKASGDKIAVLQMRVMELESENNALELKV